MTSRQFFTFLKNALFFLLDRLYKEWKYMLGNGRSYDETASKRGDIFAEQLIENLVRDRASKYDPYILEGNTTLTCGRIGLALGKSRVTGLNSLYQTHICSLTEEENRLFINVNLGAGPVAYERHIVLRIGELERKATVQISLIDIKVSIDFSIEKNGKNGYLSNFAINEMNGFKLSVNGFSNFDWTINLFLSFWTLVLGRIVRSLLENELEQFFLNRLPNYQFPVEGTSYRGKIKCNYQHEGVSSCMKQSCGTLKWSRMSPNDKSSEYDGHNSEEYETSNGFEGDMKTSSCFLEADKFAAETNSYLTEQSLDLCSGPLNKNSFNEISEIKAKELISDNSSETLESSKSLNKGFENEQSFLICKGKGKKSKIDFSKKLQVSKADEIERKFEVEKENPGQSKLEVSSEIPESFPKNVDGNAFDMGTKLPSRVASFKFSSTKLESSQINEDTLKSFGTKIETFNPTSNIGSVGFETQMEFLENVLDNIESNQDKHASDENYHACFPKGSFSDQNLDLKSCNSEMFQNESRISFTFDDFKELKGFVSSYSTAKKCQIDSESIKSFGTKTCSGIRGVKTPEIQIISNTEDKVDGNSKSTIFPDSMQQMIKVEQSFPLVDTQIISTIQLFNEKQKNEKMPFKYVKVHTDIPLKCAEVRRENELYDSRFKADGGFSADNSSDSKNLIVTFDFPHRILDLYNELVQKNVSKLEIEGKCGSFSVISKDILETSWLPRIIKGMIDSMNCVTNSQFSSSLLEEPPCSNETNPECTESTAENLPISKWKLNESSNINNLDKTLHPKPLHDLQEKIIAKTRKLVDALLEFCIEENENLGSTSLLGCDPKCQKTKLINNEVNQIQDSETGEVNCQMEMVPIYMKQNTCLESKTSSEFSSESNLETSETSNEPKCDA